MRKFLPLLASLLLTTISLEANAVKIYRLDENHTFATWHVSHFGFSDISGKFFVSGTLTFPDNDDPKGARLNADIDMNSLSTGLPNFDKKLKGADFFNVAKYPKGKFVSRRVERTGDDSAKVYGTLTFKGITKPMTLNVKLRKEAVHDFYKKRAIGFTGETSFKRSDFKIDKYAPGVSDDVTVTLEVEAIIYKIL